MIFIKTVQEHILNWLRQKKKLPRFLPHPKYFIVNCEQNVVKFAGNGEKRIEKCNFYIESSVNSVIFLRSFGRLFQTLADSKRTSATVLTVGTVQVFSYGRAEPDILFSMFVFCWFFGGKLELVNFKDLIILYLTIGREFRLKIGNGSSLHDQVRHVWKDLRVLT